MHITVAAEGARGARGARSASLGASVEWCHDRLRAKISICLSRGSDAAAPLPR
jgi:hypothetical protein